MPYAMNTKNRTMNFFHRLTLFTLLLFLPLNPALTELMLHPTRLVFAGNQRAGQLELINNGTRSATHPISLVNRRMSETGAFLEIGDPLPD